MVLKNISVTEASSLWGHKLLQGGIKGNDCDVCIKAFTLSNHTLIHSCIKKCIVFSDDCTLLSDLSRHKLTCSSIKNCQCDVCIKAFNHLFHLSKHKLTLAGFK